MDCSREVPVVSGNTTQKHNSVKKDELGGGGCQKKDYRDSGMQHSKQ